MHKHNKHTKKPMSNRRLAQLLDQHMYDSGLMTAFADPPFTPEEIAQGRYQAELITAALDKDQGVRVRAMTVATLYRNQLHGIVNFLKQVMAGQRPGEQEVTNNEQINVTENL